MRRWIWFPAMLGLAATALLLAGAAIAAGETEVYLSLEQAPRAVFPGADSIVRKDVPSTPSLREKIRKLIGAAKPSFWEPFYITYRARKKGKPLGYAVICEEIGKHRPITFIVAVTPGGAVRDVAIMIYRESRGGEVRYPGFTRQFHGKSLDDPIAHRRDIRNITGATLSARALSRGVRKALAVLQIVYLSGS